jgi:metal iron transporter
MNRPSRTDEPFDGEGFNQNPNAFSADLTTNQDFNGIANSRELRNTDPRSIAGLPGNSDGGDMLHSTPPANEDTVTKLANAPKIDSQPVLDSGMGTWSPPDDGSSRGTSSHVANLKEFLATFGKFIGPGFMIAVAYS